MSIKTVRQRSILKPNREPYWHALGTSKWIGYRRLANGGTWIAKAYDPATRKRLYRSFGDLSQFADHERFDEAVKQAEAFFAHTSKGGRSESLTVAEAWHRYAAHQRKHKGEIAARDVEARFRRYVEGDAIASVKLEKLAKRHVEAWRERLAEGKTPGTVNRDLVPMRAALRLALDDGYVTTDHVWKKALKPTGNADGRRETYLTREQRHALVDAIDDPSLRTFVTVLASLPLRPGALASLTVGDFDSRNGVLIVRHDKGHEERSVPIPDAVATVLRRAAKNKLPAAPLLSRYDGKPWDRYYWRGKVKDAVKAAKLPPETCLYTLRHSVLTDLTTGGCDLFTVAALAGTSIKMIEKHYGHLQNDVARAALAGVAL